MRKYIFFLSLLTLVISCQRENLDEIEQAGQNDRPNVTVTSTVVGLVTDESGNSVQDAVVTLGDIETYTDQFGYFTFKDELMSKDAAYVQVEKAGYFRGSRKFSTDHDESASIKIQLIQKTPVGSVSSFSGGSVAVAESSVDLPGGGYKDEDGQLYEGEILVFASYLDPTKKETHDQMPGELTGIDTEGNQNVLASYGMIGVELKGENGQYLVMPEGTEATISFKVPEQILSTAPAVIPLWHFNEFSGFWEEEGEATLVGDEYIGEVSHFSFWNCDVPFPLVEISGHVELNGLPFENGLLKISEVQSGFAAYGYTGEGGFFSGKVPEAKDLIFTLVGACGEPIFEQEISASFDNIELGQIEITADQSATVSISGTFENCEEEDFELAYVFVQGNDFEHVIEVKSDGSFSQIFPSCSNGGEVILFGVDISNGLISEPTFIEFSGDVSGIYLEACDGYFEPGIHIEYNGMNWEISADSIFFDYFVDFNVVGETVYYQMIGFDWNLFDPEEPGVGAFFIANFNHEFGDTEAIYEISFPTQGFKIEGLCDAEEIEQVGFQFIRFSGVFDGEPEVVDPSLFPEDIGVVTFDISF